MTYTELTACPAYGDLQQNALPKWSAAFPVPAIGDQIILAINRCGPAEVTGYFTEDGYLGVRCTLLSPPDWFLKQNKGNVPCAAFGAEIKLP